MRVHTDLVALRLTAPLPRVITEIPLRRSIT